MSNFTSFNINGIDSSINATGIVIDYIEKFSSRNAYDSIKELNSEGEYNENILQYIFKKLSSHTEQITDYVKIEDNVIYNIYNSSVTFDSTYNFNSKWFDVSTGCLYYIVSTNDYRNSDYRMAAKVKDGEFVGNLIVSPQDTSTADIYVYADGSFDQIYISGCNIYEAYNYCNYIPMQNLLVSNLYNMVQSISVSSSTVTITLRATRMNMLSGPVFKYNVNFINIGDSVSYTIQNFYTLVYVIEESTIEVVNITTETRPCIVLAHNESGKITYGALAVYLTDMLIQSKIEESVNNEYYGKKLLCIGDSITDQGYYVNSLTSLLGTTTYNRGVGGSTVAVSNIGYSFCERFDLDANDSTTHNVGFPSEADLITIFGGINDWGRIRSQTLGDLYSAVDTTTFYGAWHYILKGLKERYPSAKIYVLNLHHTYDAGTYKNWSGIIYNDNTDHTKGFTVATNDNNNTLEDYRTAIKEVAEFHGIDVIDLANCGISFYNCSDYDNYSTSDGLHFNQAGGDIVAHYIYNQILSK